MSVNNAGNGLTPQNADQAKANSRVSDIFTARHITGSTLQVGEITAGGNVHVDLSLDVGDNIVAGGIASAASFLSDAGSALAPSFSFVTDTSSGVYAPAVGQVAVSAGGADALVLDNAGNAIVTNIVSAAGVETGNGAVGAPSVAFSNDLTTGLYRVAASRLGVAAGGTKVVDLSATRALFSEPVVPVQTVNTSASVPVVLTATQTLNGFFTQTAGAGSTLTTPTAAALVAIVPGAVVGTTVKFVYSNASGATQTLTAGSGVTLLGSTSLVTATVAVIYFVFTNVTASSEAVSAFTVLSA